MAEPISALWMGAQPASICHRSLLPTMGLCFNEQATDREVLCHSKMMATYYPEYPNAQEPLIKEQFTRANLYWRQDQSFGNLTPGLRVETSLYPEKMEELTTGYLLYETDLELDGRRKDCASLMVGIGYRLPDDRHVATQYQTEIGEDLLSKET